MRIPADADLLGQLIDATAQLLIVSLKFLNLRCKNLIILNDGIQKFIDLCRIIATHLRFEVFVHDVLRRKIYIFHG